MTANVNDVLVVVVCFLTLQNLRPSVITRSFEITRMIRLNNTLVTYCGVDFTLLFEYPYFFRLIFGGQKFGGEFGYRRRLVGLFWVQDSCKCNRRILLKRYCDLPNNRKNWLTFGGDPVPDTDYGSLFHFSYHCGINDFRFISISHRVIGRFSRHLAKWLTPTR